MRRGGGEGRLYIKKGLSRDFRVVLVCVCCVVVWCGVQCVTIFEHPGFVQPVEQWCRGCMHISSPLLETWITAAALLAMLSTEQHLTTQIGIHTETRSHGRMVTWSHGHMVT